MTGYSDRFGGGTLQAAQVAYNLVDMVLPAYSLDWPAFADGTLPVMARIMDVDTSFPASATLTLPDASNVSAGQDVFFANRGNKALTIVSFLTAAVVAVIPAGAQTYLYLTDNGTQDGTWRSILMGVGSASVDASGLAGSGLKAVGATLAQSSLAATVSASFTLAASDRAKLYVNVGGTIATLVPITATMGTDFFLEVKNQGTGVWTFNMSGGELIDGSATLSLQPGESCIVHSSTAGEWYTVGRGRNQQFNFTQLSLALSGGTRALSLAEASNVVQTYTGALGSAQTLVLPAVVQVYYISNQTTGFPFTIQSPTPGATLSLPAGQNAVVFCDGVNVINASTSIGGISSLLLNAGTLASPSLALSVVNNGLFAPSSSSLAVSAGGVEAVRWSAAQTLAPNGTLALPAYSFTAAADSGVYAPSAGAFAIVTGATARVTVVAAGDVGVSSATPNYGAFGRALTGESATQFAYEVASSIADGASADLGSLSWWWKAQSATHNNVARVTAVSEGATANQRGGAVVLYTKANGAAGVTERMRISSAGNVGIGGASSGNILESIRDLDGAVLSVVRNVNAGVSATAGVQLQSGAAKLVNMYAQGNANNFVMNGAGGIVTKYEDFDTQVWRTNAAAVMATLSATGLNLPNDVVVSFGDGSSSITGNGTSDSLALRTAGSPRLSIDSAGVLTDTNSLELGWKTIPQNSKSAAYTLVLADSGKHIFHPSADTTARIFTIPANASVAYPIGTAVTFVNQNAAGVVTIAITTDTMRLAGLGTTGSRTLAANGIATAIKVTATEWIISGTGLS